MKPALAVTCSRCDHVLKEFPAFPKAYNSRSGITWYEQMRHELRGKCPRCSRTLPQYDEYQHSAHLEIETRIDNFKLSRYWESCFAAMRRRRQNNQRRAHQDATRPRVGERR